MAQIELFFTKEKITKNTVRYIEQAGSESDTPVVAAIYVHKSALKKLGNPDHLHVTIDDAFADNRGEMNTTK